MEVMEEGILMDRLPILLQRDMQYYEVRSVIQIATGKSVHYVTQFYENMSKSTLIF